MNKLRDKMQRFMIGRYGADQLGRFLIGVIFVLIICNLFVRSNILYVISLILLILCYWRMFSKNISRRYGENQKFSGYFWRVMEVWRKFLYRIKQAREYHIYHCPNCKQKIRVPRGKGRISIHCPKCNTDFIKKS